MQKYDGVISHTHMRSTLLTCFCIDIQSALISVWILMVAICKKSFYLLFIVYFLLLFYHDILLHLLIQTIILDQYDL